MKNTTSIILILAFCVIMLSNCKREDTRVYTISGKIVKSCNNPIPISNKAFELWYYSGNKRNDIQMGSGITDLNGSFSVNYTSTPSGVNSTLSLIASNGPYVQKSLLGNIPQNKDIYETIYVDTNYFVKVKIRAKKTFSNADTLFYYTGSFTANMKYIIGPFQDNQIIDTLYFSGIQGWGNDNHETQGVKYFSRWLLGKNYVDLNRQNETYTFIEPCKKYNDIILDLTKSNK